MTFRIIAIDTGNTCTGVVVADIRTHGLEILHVAAIESKNTKDMKRVLWEWFEREGDVFALGLAASKVCVVLESIFFYKKSGKRYGLSGNFALKALNGSIVDRFKAMGVRSRYLLPTQKADMIPGTNEERKVHAELAAEQWLVREHPYMHAKFRRFNRRHDMADALLTVKYLVAHPLVVQERTVAGAYKTGSPMIVAK